MKGKRYILPDEKTDASFETEWNRSVSIEKFRMQCKRLTRLITNEPAPQQVSYTGNIKLG